jgi:iron complex transport system permease protein
LPRSLALILGASALLAALVAGVAVGSGTATLADLFSPSARGHAIVVGYRLPRVLLGAVAGAGLAGAGAAFQTVLRNPLADPYLLGVSGGAALGATLAIAAGAGASAVLATLAVPGAAFAGGAAATALVWALARRSGVAGASLLLAGFVVNAIANACILFVEALADPHNLQALVWWFMGYIDAPAWSRLALVAGAIAAGLAVLLADAARMNVMALGDEAAGALGVDVRALERRSLLACAAVVGAVVSVAGPVGFVGLVVPQAMRRVVGPDLRLLLPASVLAGAAVLVACDTLVRLLAPALHTEVPVGAVTALLGGPAFLWLLARRARVAPPG